MDDLKESIYLLFTGLVFVLGTLTLLYAICAGIGAIFKRHGEKIAAPIKKMLTKFPFDGPKMPTSIPTLFWGKSNDATPKQEELMLVIAAAVDRMLEGQKFRIISVEPISPSHTDWARAGRNQIHTSHRVR